MDGLLPIFLLKETLSVKYTSKIVRTHSGITVEAAVAAVAAHLPILH